MKPLDPTDRRILNFLQENAKLTNKEIAGRLGMTTTPVYERIKRLEEEGYIVRPHISGGGVPSDKRYRYYVESLSQDAERTSVEERRMLAHLFHQVERELDEWTRLAAVLLSRTVHNVAVVTFPKEAESRVKHLKLVSLQQSLAMLILLLHQAKLKQQLIAFSENVLIMDFIGENDIPAPRLIEVVPEDASSIYKQVMGDLKKLVEIGMVHGDLSAYNILLLERPYFIDFSHGTTIGNQIALELLERDVKNINSYFSKLNLHLKRPEKVYEELKKIIEKKVKE